LHYYLLWNVGEPAYNAGSQSPACSIRLVTRLHPSRPSSLTWISTLLGKVQDGWLEVPHYYEKITIVDIIGLTSLRFQGQY
jgi:hypothetical protein